MIPRLASFQAASPAGFHEVRYVEWGDPAADRVVICCHGLTRNGRDFDILARRLARDSAKPHGVLAWLRRLFGKQTVKTGTARSPAGFRVVCPDVAGRGRSDWLKESLQYGYPQYLADMTLLIASLGVRQVDWIGTSMGGLIGMFLAAAPNSPIRSLVMNDVGPVLSGAALRRIADYVGREESFGSLAEVETHLRQVHAPFGPLTDAQWAHLAAYGHRIRDDGSYGLAYDPGIAVNVRLGVRDWDFWTTWNLIQCRTLVLRGELSDILSAETAQNMTRSGPRAELVTFPEIGHAPALMSQDQTEIVAQWLAR